MTDGSSCTGREGEWSRGESRSSSTVREGEWVSREGCCEGCREEGCGFLKRQEEEEAAEGCGEEEAAEGCGLLGEGSRREGR